MDDEIFTGIANGAPIDGNVLHTLNINFGQVQNILDQNRLLINEINKNQESKIPHNLTRNVGLIKELNNNIRRVVDLYTDLSSSCAKSMGNSSEEESANKYDGRGGQKRIRSNS